MFFKYSKEISGMSQAAQEEIDLIQKVQMNNDLSAMRKLVKLYRPVMAKVIQKGNVTTKCNMTQDEAISICENIFRELVPKYNLSMGVQPNTYFQGLLTQEMQKLTQRRDGRGVRLTAMNNLVGGQVEYVEKLLETQGIEATPSNIEKTIRNELGTGGNYLDKKSIESYLKKRKKEFSGNQRVGSTGEFSVANYMTLDDMFQPQKATGDELMKEKLEKQRIKSIVEDKANGFTRQEKKFLYNLIGIGEYEFNVAQNKNTAALNAGITYSQGTAAINKLKKLMGK